MSMTPMITTMMMMIMMMVRAAVNTIATSIEAFTLNHDATPRGWVPN